MEYARLQEEALGCDDTMPNKDPYYAQKNVQTPALYNTEPPLLPTPTSALKLPAPVKNTQTANKTFEHIPADVRAEKIAKGLCYFCDQPYSREHKCKFRETQLFTVEIEGNDQEPDNKIEADWEDDSGTVKEPNISVNALSGSQSFYTMRVKGVG